MNGVNVGLDLSPVSEYTELVGRVAELLDSSATRANITESIGISAKSAFGTFADEQAILRPLDLFHVYDVGQTGQPQGRLWTTVLSGAQSEKTLEFDWRPANRVNRVGKRRNPTIPGDTRNSVHRFVWKAPMMEEGYTTTISAGAGKQTLAFPYGEGMGFTKGSKTITSSRRNINKFTEMWEDFWSEMVEDIVHQDFTLPTEKFFGQKIPAALLQITSRPMAKPIGITVETKPKRDMSALAAKEVNELNTGFIRAARQREVIAGGNASDL